LKQPSSTHLSAAEGWLELGNHKEALNELKEIDPQLNTHPDVLEIHLRVSEMMEDWNSCVDIANTLTKSMPEKLSYWIRRSYALHKLKRTQEAYDQLKPSLDSFEGEWLPLYNLACYTCMLGNVNDARKLIEKAIELGGNAVRLRALDDDDLVRVWAGP